MVTDLEASPPARGRPRDGALDERILEQLLVLNSRGYAGLTLDELAVRSGVAKSTILRRWPSKAAMVDVHRTPAPLTVTRARPDALGEHRRRRSLAHRALPCCEGAGAVGSVPLVPVRWQPDALDTCGEWGGRMNREQPAPADEAAMVTVARAMRPAATIVETRAHLAAAAYLKGRSQDTALVVVADDGNRAPVGVITHTDVSRAVADGRDPEVVHVSEVIRGRRPVTVEPGASVDAALRLMLEAGVHHLVVVENGSTAGVVEMADLCRSVLGLSDGGT